MLYYERKFKKLGYDLIIGVDEAGRGPLAGPVVACAVALKRYYFKQRIDDSKKLTALQRERAFREIICKSIFGVGIIDKETIDRLNILVATRLAMEQAVRGVLGKLKSATAKKFKILVDGNVRLFQDFPVINIIKGDAKSKSIASASILAKVIRDRIMIYYDRLYPEYGFLQHKGYPTKKHKIALKKFGPSRIHRLTFAGV